MISELKPQIKNLPNALSFLRLALVPVFIFAFTASQMLLCAIVFAISGVSDAIDGFVARKFHCESNLGKILDPIADKFTYATAFFCLYSKGKMPTFFIVIFVAIQVLQGLGALFLYKKASTVVKSNFTGKIAGFLMFAFCLVSLLFYDKLSKLFINIASSVVLFFIALSGLNYLGQYIVKPKVDSIKDKN